jgi:hypothetical protein
MLTTLCAGATATEEGSEEEKGNQGAEEEAQD